MLRRIIASAAFCLAALAAIAGSTWALVGSTTQVDGNSFITGTVAIISERDDGQPINGPLFYSVPSQDPGGAPELATGYWVPGMTATRNLNVRNAGSLKVRIDGLGATHTGDPTVWESLQVSIRQGSKLLYTGPLSALEPGPYALDPANRLILYPGGTSDIGYEVSLPLTAGNDAAGRDILVAFQVYASQMSNVP